MLLGFCRFARAWRGMAEEDVRQVTALSDWMTSSAPCTTAALVAPYEIMATASARKYSLPPVKSAQKVPTRPPVSKNRRSAVFHGYFYGYS